MDKLDRILNEWKIDNTKYNHLLAFEKIKIVKNYRKKNRQIIFTSLGVCICLIIGIGYSIYSTNKNNTNINIYQPNNYTYTSYENTPNNCVYDGSDSDIICYTLLEE